MSKSTEEFKKMMESDRGEAQLYETAAPEDQVYLPITRAGFDAMVAKACGLVNLDVTGPNRNIAVAFLHSLPRGTSKTSVRALSDAIWNSLAMHTSYTIDQEIKKEANQELAEEAAKIREAQKELHQGNKSKRKADRQASRLAGKGGTAAAVKLPPGSPDENTN